LTQAGKVLELPGRWLARRDGTDATGSHEHRHGFARQAGAAALGMSTTGADVGKGAKLGVVEGI